MGKYAQPLRIALTGSGVSPELVDTLAFFDRDEAIGRLRRCADRVGAP